MRQEPWAGALHIFRAGRQRHGNFKRGQERRRAAIVVRATTVLTFSITPHAVGRFEIEIAKDPIG